MSAGGGGTVLNTLEMCAELAERGYRPWEIDDLDRWWIAHVIFHPRDQHGRLSVSPKRPANKDEDDSPFGRWQKVGRMWGKADWLIQFEWESFSRGRTKCQR